MYCLCNFVRYNKGIYLDVDYFMIIISPQKQNAAIFQTFQIHLK